MTNVDQAEAQAPPPAPAPPGVPGAAGSPAEMRTLSASDVARLRQARSELSSQLTSAEGRREELVEQLKTAPEAAIPGIRERLQVLDERIAQIERDIQTTGRELALAPREAGTTQPDGRSNPGFWNSDVGEFAGVTTTIVLAFAAIRLILLRTRAKPAPLRDPEADLRMERLEQAVDAIAIEVERVGEAQRFQAKLLSEGPAQPIGVQARSAEQVGR